MDRLPNPDNNPVREAVNSLLVDVKLLKEEVAKLNRNGNGTAVPVQKTLEPMPQYPANREPLGWRPVNDGSKLWMPPDPGHPEYTRAFGPGAVAVELIPRDVLGRKEGEAE